MTPTIDTDTAAAVFAAATNGTVRRTNLGRHINVSLGGYTYRVAIPDTYRAHIEYREGFGGIENVAADATPAQDRTLRDAHTA